MIINKFYDGIYEIENFISDSECGEIFKIIDSTKESDWFCERDDYTTPEFWYGKSVFFNENQHKVIQDINKRLEDLFVFSYAMSKITNISRYRKDEAMGRHRDNHTKEENGSVSSAYGVVLYYNDDYLGGEIEYPEIDIKIKPKAKSLIVHSGDILHGTSPVLSDSVRYFSTGFVKEKVGTAVTLNPNIFGNI